MSEGRDPWTSPSTGRGSRRTPGDPGRDGAGWRCRPPWRRRAGSAGRRRSASGAASRRRRRCRARFRRCRSPERISSGAARAGRRAGGGRGVSTGIASALEIEGGFIDRLVASPVPRVATPSSSDCVSAPASWKSRKPGTGGNPFRLLVSVSPPTLSVGKIRSGARSCGRRRLLRIARRASARTARVTPQPRWAGRRPRGADRSSPRRRRRATAPPAPARRR